MATTSSLSTSALSAPLYQATGLASNMDTGALVDKIIAADSAPMNSLNVRKAAYNVQISTIGTLTSKLTALDSATSALASSGVASIKPTSTYADFTVSGTANNVGNYTVQVSSVAQVAKMRSSVVSSASDPAALADGQLQFSIDGKATASIDTTGKSLSDVVTAINAGIPEVTASVITTSAGSYLSLARKDTGFATSDTEALKVLSDPGLGLNTIQYAKNAKLTVDGLEVDSQSNDVSGIIPGLTFTLTGESNASTHLVLASSNSSAADNLNQFISAYNDVANLLTSQLRPDPTKGSTEDRLDGSTIYILENRLHSLLSQKVNSSGPVQTLTDLGVKLQKDGTLTLDTGHLAKSLMADAGAVNQVFSKSKSGISALVSSLVDSQTNSRDGALTTRSTALQSNIKMIDDRTTQMQDALDKERTRLTAQFTAMEQTMSKLNSVATYLDNLQTQLKANSK